MKNNKILILIVGILCLLSVFFFQNIKNTVSNIIKSQTMNNPFNIRNLASNKWEGLSSNSGAFCSFIDVKYGIRAMIKIYRNNLKAKINTIEKFVSKFAPPSENDTAGYINFVSARTGIHSANHTLTIDDEFSILSAMAKMENNYELDRNLYNEAVKLL